MTPPPHLFCFGLGFSALTVARQLLQQGYRVSGTCREDDKAARMRDLGITPMAIPLQPNSLDATITHVLVSIPPGPDGDFVARDYGKALEALPHLEWLGYLSTTAVYGDQDGGWIDEDAPLSPTSARGRKRLSAEHAWQALTLPLHIFRLAGIYGPGRNQIEKLRAGKAHRVIKPGHIVSRVHVDDVAQTVLASIAQPNPGRIYNICDDEAAPPQDVVEFAAKLSGLAVPPDIAIEDATLSPMALSFYAESKRVRNSRIKTELGVKLLYPTYRDGLTALFRQSR